MAFTAIWVPDTQLIFRQWNLNSKKGICLEFEFQNGSRGTRAVEKQRKIRKRTNRWGRRGEIYVICRTLFFAKTFWRKILFIIFFRRGRYVSVLRGKTREPAPPLRACSANAILCSADAIACSPRAPWRGLHTYISWDPPAPLPPQPYRNGKLKRRSETEKLCLSRGKERGTTTRRGSGLSEGATA